MSDYRYKQLFYDICDYREIHDSYGGKNYDLVLCHYPIFSWKGMNKGTILLYGHTHNSAEDVYFQKCLAGMEANNCRHVGDKPIQAYLSLIHILSKYKIIVDEFDNIDLLVDKLFGDALQ